MFDPTPAAEELYQARITRRSVGPFRSGIAPTNEAEGIAVQFTLAKRMGVVAPAGFKIGATAKHMQLYLGLAEPAGGFMSDRSILPNGAELNLSELFNPGVECEIGVRLSSDLPPGACDFPTAAAAVGELFAAIEVVENRYGPGPAGDLKALGTPTLIGDQVYHSRAVLGKPASNWPQLDLTAISGQIAIDGEVRGVGHGGDLLGNPLRALAWLAGSPFSTAFGGLRKGQVILLGSVTPPVWLSAPCRVTVTFEEIPTASVVFR